MRKIISEYIGDLRLITRNIRLFLLGALLMGLLMAVMQLLLNLYLKEIGYGEAFIGKVLSMVAFGGVLAALPAAYLVARYRIKPVLIVTSVCMTAAFVGLVLTGRSELILSAAFVIGFMQSVRNVAAAPFIMRNTSDTERTLIFSLNFSTWIVAGIIGSYGGGWLHGILTQQFGELIAAYRYTLLAAGGVGLLAILPFSLIAAKAPAEDEVAKVFSWKSLRAKGALFFRLTFPFFLLGAGAGLIIPFLNLYFQSRFSLNAHRIGFYFSMLQLAMLLAVLAVPVMKRRIGYIRTVVLTELLSIPFMLILCFTENLNVAFWAFLLRGALMNMGQPVGTEFMMQAVDPSDHGLINSLASIAWAVSWAVAAPIGGAMIEKGGFEPAFLVAIGLYICSAALYYIYFSRSERFETGRFVVDLSGTR